LGVVLPATATSRTPPWLLSGSGCRFRQCLTRVAVHCLQANDLLAAKGNNQAAKHRLAAHTLADLAYNFRYQPLPRRVVLLASKSHFYLGLGNEVEKGGLLKLYRKSFFRVSSNTLSPVLLSKSARTMLSLSVRRLL
jgi:hypothetical protein